MLMFSPVLVIIATIALGNALPDLSTNRKPMSSASTAEIMNFAETSIKTVPYQISIGYLDGPNKTYIHWCSGTIISNEWAVSGAHCFDPRFARNTSTLIIFSGSANLGNYTEGSFHTIINDIFYPWYLKSYFDNETTNDIILLRVAEPFEFGPTRKSVPLYDNNEVIVPKSRATVSGWGRNNNSNEESHHPKVLNRFDVIIMSKYDCNTVRHGELSYGGQICTLRDEAYHDKICSSDTGGPLVSNGRLAGVVSAGSLPCPDPLEPAVYAEVAHFRNWIRETTGV